MVLNSSWTQNIDNKLSINWLTRWTRTVHIDIDRLETIRSHSRANNIQGDAENAQGQKLEYLQIVSQQCKVPSKRSMYLLKTAH